ncbi:prenyltransferase [Sporomusa ovata DSM 2662]|uniref:UbiA prenyltransferase n=1 Tax=Sporomusa ovata TaxID=2378 RepID=A0A0U1L288_9FIRM|nr:UbiA family prenyltransferase [Sporomusa ovata]EQB25219.1 UbiA prenyltransferase [Sporomusa ovata DSM 2662]CQR73782.1 hypothetical protein SpAn4DRAFT_0244 [Sporomusa ovata]
MKLLPLLKITRAPNLITAITDVIAGAFIVSGGIPEITVLMPLCLISVCLYAAGVVQNDIVDAKSDAVERPERPLPSGAINIIDAYYLSAVFFLSGLFLAKMIGTLTLLISTLIVVSVFVYNCRAKNSRVFGSLIMGLCRALNLSLGFTINPIAFGIFIPLCLFPLFHIAGVTLVSRGEVDGLGRGELMSILTFHICVLAGLVATASFDENLISLLAIGLYAGVMVGGALPAMKDPIPGNIRLLVRNGIIALSLLDASLVAIFVGIELAVIIICLGLLSRVLASYIEMT